MYNEEYKDYTVRGWESITDKLSEGKANWDDVKNFLEEWAQDKEKKGDIGVAAAFRRMIENIKISDARRKRNMFLIRKGKKI